MSKRTLEWLRGISDPPPRIDTAGGWWVDEPHDPKMFFDALLVLLPAGSMLALEDPSTSTYVQNALRKLEVAATLEIHGAPLLGSKFIHLPFDQSTRSVLNELISKDGIINFCIHIYAYKGEDILVEWHDASSGNGIVVSSLLDEGEVLAFGKCLGVEVTCITS